MRYLKTFENWEILVPKDEQFGGLTKKFINDMFLDLSDGDFKISIYFDKRAITEVDKENGKMIISAIPYIWLRCDIETHTSLDSSTPFKPKDQLESFRKSNEFKEIIDTANDRLDDFGWYVSDAKTISNQLKIFIHRIEDKKYVV
jgi:hypothetical protein